MFSDIFSILAIILLIAVTGFAYSFSASKNRSLPVKIISAIVGFSLAATLLSFLYSLLQNCQPKSGAYCT